MLRVLAYHRIARPHGDPGLDPALVSAAPEVFRRQMLHLHRWYRPVSLADLIAAFHHGHPLPRRAVHVTVDDAYRDFRITAWPVLRELGIPVTLFVPTAYPGDPSRSFWWDRLERIRARAPADSWDRAARRAAEALPVGPAGHEPHAEWDLGSLRSVLREVPHDDAERAVELALAEAGVPPAHETGPASVLDWDELRALQEEGVTIGAHTRHHVALPHVGEERVRSEILGSLEDLRRELGEGPRALAYPYGLADGLTLRVMREEGCALGFSMADGLARPGRTEPMCIPRTNVTLRTSSPVFKVRMIPWFARVDRWRHRHQFREMRVGRLEEVGA